MARLNQVVLHNLNDYHDTVKEEAQLLLVSMTQRFLPPQIALQQEQLDLVQVLRANMSNGWPNQLNGQLKDAAKMETDMLDYLFVNASEFLSETIQIYMDERTTRDNLLTFFKLINVACPFLIMNDYRVAKQGGMLQRVQVLEKLMVML